MEILPGGSAFAARHAGREPQLVWTTLVGDLETPVSAFLKLAGGKPHSFLFESVEGGAVRGRYSIIGLDPDLIFRAEDGRAEINREAREKPGAFAPCKQETLSALRDFVAESKLAIPPELPPMAAGIFGYLGYDVVRQMEKLPRPNPDPIGIPDAILIRPTVIVVFDAVKDAMTVITPVRPEKGVGAKAAQAAATERLSRVADRLEKPLDKQPPPPNFDPLQIATQSNTTPAEFERMVLAAKEYIMAGDVFQVVLSQRFEAPFPLPPFSLYRALRRTNPAPYLYYLDFGGFAVAGSSPEILVTARNGKVTVRPLAGTRPRGATPTEDEALAAELLADPKERAEHLMLLDLGRNDVGRVAAVGEVKVTDSFFIERYSHVMHLVSNVEGNIRDGLDAIDALAAGLPAGTLSGAPKIRAMQLIDEFEKEKRGAVYAGAVGYFAADGSMDTCIVLRTALVKDGMMYVQAGGGIVADSVPEAEYQETVNKAKALMSAADEAVRYASAARK